MKRALTTLALVLVYAACGDAANVESPGRPGCTADAQCNSGQVCLGNGCVAPDANLAAEVIPPSNSGLLAEDFADILDGGQISLHLDPLGGFSITANVLPKVPIAVSVVGTSLVVPDHQEAAKVTITASGQELTTPAGNYSLSATPLDGITPPLEIESLPLQASGTYAPEFLSFVQDGGWTSITGEVSLSPLFLANAAASTPVTFAVQAFLPGPTAEPISQAVTIGTDGGYTFSLLIPSQYAPSYGNSGISLDVTPLTGTAPSFSQTLTSLPDQVRLELGEGLNLVVIQGQVTSVATGQPVSNAQVTLMGSLSSMGSETFVSATVLTDAMGNIGNVVVAHDLDHMDSYTALIVPPANSGLAAYLSSPPVVLNPGLMTTVPIAVEIPSAVTVTGRVVDSTLSPAAGSIVRCSPDAQSNTGSVPLSQASATTQADGTFSMSLTPGNYDFDFSSPVALALPSSSRGPIAVGLGQQDGGITTATQVLSDFQLSTGRTVTGTLQDSNGNAVNDALVRIVIVPPHDQGTPNVVRRSIVVSEAQVVPGGTFTVVIPTNP